MYCGSAHHKSCCYDTTELVLKYGGWTYPRLPCSQSTKDTSIIKTILQTEGIAQLIQPLVFTSREAAWSCRSVGRKKNNKKGTYGFFVCLVIDFQ